MKVVVVGGGWSGLAAAVELVRNGVVVTLLEASAQLGGRARSLHFGDYRIDNGQHLLLGAYRGVLSLLAEIGVCETEVFRRVPLLLSLRDARGRRFELSTHRFPAPLHTLLALASARGLTLSERLAAARVVSAARTGIAADVPLAHFLDQQSQGKKIVAYLWEPLCLAALNTPLAEASTTLFLNVLREAFLGDRADSDMLLPITDLGHCLPAPGAAFIEQKGGTIRTRERVRGLVVNGCRARGVQLDGKELHADAVILATAPRAAVDLLEPHAALRGLASNIDRLGHAPICTLYLRYPEPVRLPHPFVGLLAGDVHWLFDRGQLTREPGVMAAVISGPGKHMGVDNAELAKKMIGDIAHHFPEWPAPISTKLVREKQATFIAAAGCEQWRPTNVTSVSGLWLAGDYTATGLPGTLEGAVSSGIQCARLILGQDFHHEKLSAAS